MKNIIITGGELFNKGAQAMVFVTVSELKRRYPKHKIYVLSTEDLKRPVEERKQYSFDFLGWHPVKFAKAQNNPLLRLGCLIRNKSELLECEEVYRNCDLMIDISGYALGSNWSYGYCRQYLDHIQFAKSFDIPMYIMPQSIGPFDFHGEHAAQLLSDCKRLLPYPRAICAREKEGFDNLSRTFDLKNIVHLPDLVLNNRKVDINSIYQNDPNLFRMRISGNSVGVIPNTMTVSACDEDTILSIWKNAIQEILKLGNDVYILSHATHDIELCKKIKNLFIDDERVHLVDEDLNCVEFNEIVKQFKFVIASRFHAVVHSFKNGVPCIAIGWATKYHDLLKKFEQECYSFDAREGISINKLQNAIYQLNKESGVEAEKIISHLKEIQRENVFDILDK